MLKVLSQLGHVNSKCCIIYNWSCFSVLKMFHLSPKRLLQFSLTGEKLLLNSMWECPYRLVKDTYEL